MHLAFGAKRNVIEYFFQPSCKECQKADVFILPQLEERYAGRYLLKKYDIGIKENYLRLVAYQERLHIDDNAPVCMIINGTIYLGGYKQIESRLFSLLDSPQAIPPPPASVSGNSSGKILRRRVASFSWGAIGVAGLVDGINPCVFTTLIFFLSLLSASKITGRKLLLVGGTYCIACFLAYLALGLGLFRFLKLLSGYHLLQEILEGALLFLLILLAFLSFRDAWKFRTHQDPRELVLQLPDNIKQKIHAVMRRGLQYRYLLPGAFAIGVVVTALESVCSGQIYLPTLTLMVKEGGSDIRVVGYLLFYNLMFILPLLFLFAAAYCGISSAKFLRWSKMNVLYGKYALGCFFLLLAGILIFLRS